MRTIITEEEAIAKWKDLIAFPNSRELAAALAALRYHPNFGNYLGEALKTMHKLGFDSVLSPSFSTGAADERFSSILR